MIDLFESIGLWLLWSFGLLGLIAVITKLPLPFDEEACRKAESPAKDIGVQSEGKEEKGI